MKGFLLVIICVFTKFSLLMILPTMSIFTFFYVQLFFWYKGGIWNTSLFKLMKVSIRNNSFKTDFILNSHPLTHLHIPAPLLVFTIKITLGIWSGEWLLYTILVNPWSLCGTKQTINNKITRGRLYFWAPEPRLEVKGWKAVYTKWWCMFKSVLYPCSFNTCSFSLLCVLTQNGQFSSSNCLHTICISEGWRRLLLVQASEKREYFLRWLLFCQIFLWEPRWLAPISRY